MKCAKDQLRVKIRQNILDTTTLQIGDIVRVRRSLELVPLDKRTPSFIPAGIYGQVVDISEGMLGEAMCWVEFHEPYDYVSKTALEEHLLELVFRIPF